MKQKLRRPSMIIAMVMAVIYLSYRGLYTLNLSSVYAVFASLSLYGAECYGCFLMFLYFFQIWEVKNPDPVPSLPGRTVDVFIPTYNEDPDLLRGTIGASLRIEYPHKTYVLDDGKRPEVKALCEELGAEYVTRPSNIHAKAGNLNHALEITEGEFLIIFDADHVAEPHFIDRLIGYFADEKLGFIQTPHAFYNYDAYQGVLNYEKGKYWEEGMLFYNVTQPGKNYWNGVSFCGSAAMFRRSALEEVNLVATESITEDMHTGMRMHAKGWGSLFVNERLISAQAASDITSFNVQRLRWGEGNLGIIGFDNPATMKGLTFAQRLCYLGSMLSWTTGVQKLLIYIAPMLMMLTGIPPVVNLSWTLCGLTLTYMAAVWTGVKISSNGYGKLWAIELTQMACFWVQVKATWRAVFNRKKANFVVTSKRGRQSNSVLKQIAPQIWYIIGSTVSLTWAVTRYFLHLSDDLIGLSIGGALLVIHSWLAWVVIRRALRPDDQRYSWRHPAALHVTFEMTDSLGERCTGQGVTRDINERGLGLVTFCELPENSEINVTISAGGRTVTCPAEIRWRKTLVNYKSRRDGLTQAFRYGLQFGELGTEQLDTLWWMGAQYAVARQYEKFEGGQFGIDPDDIATLPARKGELPVQLPVAVELWEGDNEATVTETVGQKSFTMMLANHVPDGQALELILSTPFGPVQGWATVTESQLRRIAGQDLYETRAELLKFEEESRGMLTSTLGHGTSRDLAPIVRLLPKASPLPAARPAAVLGGTAAAAAVLVTAASVFLQRDEAVIARINDGVEVSPSSVDRLEEMVTDIRESKKIDEAQVLRLRAAMKKLGREEDVAELDKVLATHATKSLQGQILKAVSLQNLGRAQDAEEIFVPLVKRLDDFADDDTRAEFLLAAARNSANLEKLDVAEDRFARMWQYGLLHNEARIEYAGVLWKSDNTQEATKLLESGSGTTAERHLLASIYSSNEQFDEAIAIYQQLLAENSDDAIARRRLAENYLWGKHYDEAIIAFEELQSDGSDTELQHRLAQAYLWSKRYTDAITEFTELLADDSENRDYQSGFLLAASNVNRLTSDEERLLRSLIKQRGDHKDDAEFLVHLLNAASKLNDAPLVLPLLEDLLALHPDDVQLRLRFADGLQAAGRYREAEQHYAWLLKHTRSSEKLDTTRSRRRSVTR